MAVVDLIVTDGKEHGIWYMVVAGLQGCRVAGLQGRIVKPR